MQAAINTSFMKLGEPLLTLVNTLQSNAPDDQKTVILEIAKTALKQIEDNLKAQNAETKAAFMERYFSSVISLKLRASQIRPHLQGLILATLIGKNSPVRECKIKWKPAFAFSPSFAFQVHPENNTLDILEKINQAYTKIRSQYGQDVPEELTYLPEDHPESTDSKIVMQQEISKSLSTECIIKFKAALPPETSDFHRALDYIEKEILPIPLAAMTEAQFLFCYQQINSYLAPEYAGYIRHCIDFVMDPRRVPPDQQHDVSALEQALSKYASPEEMNVWRQQTKAKLANVFDNPLLLLQPNYFENKDIKVLSHIAYFSPPPQDITSLLNTFAKEFLSKAKASTDPYELAAFVHHQITFIHACGDSNGRTARLMMNIVLRQAGEPPILIDNDDNYTAAVRSNDIGVFCNYIKGLRAKQPKLPKFIESCLDDFRRISRPKT